jgi:lipase ATG15
MLPTYLLISLLVAIPATTTQVPLVYQPSPLTFHLRHLHAVTNSSRILFSDVPQEALQNNIHGIQESYTLMTRMVKTHRPSSFAAHARARMKPLSHGEEGDVEELSWGEDEIIGPDVTNRNSLLHLAKMTNNAYAYPNDGNGRHWYDLGHDWNTVCVFLHHVHRTIQTSYISSELPVWLGRR